MTHAWLLTRLPVGAMAARSPEKALRNELSVGELSLVAPRALSRLEKLACNALVVEEVLELELVPVVLLLWPSCAMRL